jgi:hypothetical protein
MNRNARPLNEQVTMWVSPTAEDGRRGNKPPRPWDTGVPLSQQVASGPVPSGSREPTEKPGALNPEFVSWLMGYPPEWLKLRALGNAIVPQVAAEFIRAYLEADLLD